MGQGFVNGGGGESTSARDMTPYGDRRALIATAKNCQDVNCETRHSQHSELLIGKGGGMGVEGWG